MNGKSHSIGLPVPAVIVAAMTALLVSCAGYRLGSMLPPNIRSVHVPTFVNKTGEPLLEVETTRAAIQEFQRDGTLRIAGPSDADTVLEVVLTELKIAPVRYERDRTTTASEYRMTIMASIVLKERATGKIICKNPSVEGREDFVFSGDLTSGKRIAVPKAARELAQYIVQSVVEYW